MERCLRNTHYFANLLTESDLFELVCDPKLPIVAFRFKHSPDFSELEFTHKLRAKGWMLPCYQMPKNIAQTVMRVVVREDLTQATLLRLVNDMQAVYLQGNKVV